MKALFLILGNDQKVIESAKLIASFKQQNPFSRINILIDKENIEIARNIKSIDMIHTINTSKIKELNSKRIYSQSTIINQFINDLKEVKSTTWDLVHNFSNNNASAYIMSFLKSTKKTGAYFNNNHLLNHSNTWAAILNTQVSKLDTAITQYTAQKHILGIDENNINIPFLIDSNNLEAAQTTFKNLRGNLAPNTRLLGLTVFANENEENKIKLIEELIDIGGHYPVLITSQDTTDVDYASAINRKFEGALLQIEVDLATLPAVMLNIDLLITDDKRSVAYANSVDTPTLTSQYSLLKTASTGSIYYIEQGQIHERITELLNHFGGDTSHPLNGISFTYEDSLGITFKTANIDQDIKTNLKRLATFISMGYPLNDTLKEEFVNNYGLTPLRNLMPEIKEDLSKSLTIVLSAIRILKQYQNSDRHEKSFWAKLSQVFSLEKENIITRDFISLFCTNIYSIDTGNKDENLLQIETHLYTLKNNIGLLNDTIQYINQDDRAIQNRIVTTNL